MIKKEGSQNNSVGIKKQDKTVASQSPGSKKVKDLSLNTSPWVKNQPSRGEGPKRGEKMKSSLGQKERKKIMNDDRAKASRRTKPPLPQQVPCGEESNKRKKKKRKRFLLNGEKKSRRPPVSLSQTKKA